MFFDSFILGVLSQYAKFHTCTVCNIEVETLCKYKCRDYTKYIYNTITIYKILLLGTEN